MHACHVSTICKSNLPNSQKMHKTCLNNSKKLTVSWPNKISLHLHLRGNTTGIVLLKYVHSLNYITTEHHRAVLLPQLIFQYASSTVSTCFY